MKVTGLLISAFIGMVSAQGYGSTGRPGPISTPPRPAPKPISTPPRSTTRPGPTYRPPPGQTGVPGPVVGPQPGQIITLIYSFSGIATYDRHACIFRNGDFQLRGPYLEVGQDGVFIVESGFATTATGEQFTIDGGLLHGILLPSTNEHELRRALARSGITLEEFIQQTGAIPPEHGVWEATAGVLSINGIYRNVRTGVAIAVKTVEVAPSTQLIGLDYLPQPSLGTLILAVNGIVTFDRHACIFRRGEALIRGPRLEIGEDGVFSIKSGFATTETGERVYLGGGLAHVIFLDPTDEQDVRRALARADMTLEQFIQQTGTLPANGLHEITAGVISINGIYKNINAGVLVPVHVQEIELGLLPGLTGRPAPISAQQASVPGLISGSQPGLIRTLIYTYNGIATFDRHACIFRNGEAQIRGPYLEVGQDGVFTMESGFAISPTGERFSMDGGLFHLVILSSTDEQELRRALARARITLEEFIQQTGTLPPEEGVYEITAGVISINGIYRNIHAGVGIILKTEEVAPSAQLIGQDYLPQPSLGTLIAAINGIVTFDRHACIFRRGEALIRGPLLEIGEDGVYSIKSGFATTETEERVYLGGGLFHGVVLDPSDEQDVRRALARADMTLEQFTQQTGSIPDIGVFEITAGVISINGIYKNINAGVFVPVHYQVVQPGQLPGSTGRPAIFSTQQTYTPPVQTTVPGPVAGPQPGQVITLIYTFNGIATFDRHACIFRNGEAQIRGPYLEVGQDGVFTMESGFAISPTGERFSMDGGLFHLVILSSTDEQELRRALARARITLEEFVQQTGTLPPEEGVYEITAGVISINGIYKNIHAGVGIILKTEEVAPSTQLIGQDYLPQPSLGTIIAAVNGIVTFDRHACIFRNGEALVRGPFLEVGQDGVFSIKSGFATTETGERVYLGGGLMHAVILASTDEQALRRALARADMTLEQFIQQTGPLPERGIMEITAGVISINGIYKNINAGVLLLHAEEVDIGQLPGLTPGLAQTGPQPPQIVTLIYSLSGIATFDRHACIFRNGEYKSKGPLLEVGQDGVFIVGSGFATTATGERFTIDGGLVHVVLLPSTDNQELGRALARTGITLEEFIQQTGAIPPEQGIFEATAGVLSINGIYRNIWASLAIVLKTEEVAPGSQLPGPEDYLPQPSLGAFIFAVDGIVTFDRHACIFRNAEARIRGPFLEIGQDGVFNIKSGFATTETGERVYLGGGLVHLVVLPSTDEQAIRHALARADMTLEEFIQQTGALPAEKGVVEVTAGVISINGIYKNINAGVLIVVREEVLEPGQLPGPTDRPAPTYLPGSIIGPQTQTVFITEKAVPDTRTLYQPVTLTKTTTIDEYITITSPVYNILVATFTSFVQRTVTLPEQQVIRSPVAGSVIVNTVPVSSQIVMTVTDTTTNYFVQTGLQTVTSILNHLTPNFSFKTVTVNYPTTTTVVQTITRTSIATTYLTNTVRSTFYTITTITISLGSSATETSMPVYY